MSQPQRSARSVFVGNIPYDATEEQLTEVFSEVGPVVSFRLVFDRDTGKPKGYGFCEYRDAETALSAMRNLNNREFSTRNLRVDFAESEKASMQALAAQSNALGNRNKPNIPNFSQAPSTVESIVAMVAEMQPHTTYEVVAKIKMLVQQYPADARQLLLSSPPLTQALLQAQMKLGMLNTAAMQKLVARASANPMMMNAPGMGPASVPAPGMNPAMGMQMGNMPRMAPMMPAPMNAMPMPMGSAGPFPGKMTGFPANPLVAPSGMGGNMDQSELIHSIMSLTQEQIDALPLETRQQIQTFKQSLLGADPNQRWG